MKEDKIRTWYISEDFKSYESGEDDNPFKNENVDVLAIYNLYCAIICDKQTLFNLLGVSGNEDTDELGYAWLSSNYNKIGKIIFNNDKQLCDENGIKEWYICDTYYVHDNQIDVIGLKAIFIGTRTNFMDIILDLKCNKDRSWTFITKIIDLFIIDGITVKTK